MSIPKLKKKVRAFISKEDGNISKQQIIKTGIISISIGLVMAESTIAECKELKGDNYYITNCKQNCASGVKFECKQGDTECNPLFHKNDMNLALESNSIAGSHDHCFSSCPTEHCSHSSHSSHGHGGWG